jgi:hypothetical protein
MHQFDAIENALEYRRKLVREKLDETLLPPDSADFQNMVYRHIAVDFLLRVYRNDKEGFSDPEQGAKELAAVFSKLQGWISRGCKGRTGLSLKHQRYLDKAFYIAGDAWPSMPLSEEAFKEHDEAHLTRRQALRAAGITALLGLGTGLAGWQATREMNKKIANPPQVSDEERAALKEMLEEQRAMTSKQAMQPENWKDTYQKWQAADAIEDELLRRIDHQRDPGNTLYAPVAVVGSIATAAGALVAAAEYFRSKREKERLDTQQIEPQIEAAIKAVTAVIQEMDLNRLPHQKSI